MRGPRAPHPPSISSPGDSTHPHIDIACRRETKAGKPAWRVDRRTHENTWNSHSGAKLKSSSLHQIETRSRSINHSFPQTMLLGLVLLLVVFSSYKYFNRDPRRRHLPPKAPGWPIINHTLLHLETEFPWRLIRWTRQYGEIFRTKSAATDFIWLSSPRAVKELIDRRSAIYSSRQPQPMALGAASGGKRMTFMPKGKQWRTLRAIIHRVRNLAWRQAKGSH
jgi:Cytochrome P450